MDASDETIEKILTQLPQPDHRHGQSHQDLAHERNLLRTLIDILPDFIYVKDTSGRFIISNLAHARALGARSPDDVIGKADFDLCPHELAQRYYADDRAVLESGRPLFNREEPYLNPAGEIRWGSSSKLPLRDDQGNIVGLVGIGRDITDRKQAQEALHRAHAQLEIRVKERTAELSQANAVLKEQIAQRQLAQRELAAFREKMVHAEHLASLGTLSAVMAHELNQPLTVIRLFLQQVLRGLKNLPVPQMVVDNLNESLVEVSNAIAIIDRFRNFTRRPSFALAQDIDVPAIVQRIVAVLAESARRAKIRLLVRPMDRLPGLEANVADLEQLFFILIQNAIHAADGKKFRQLVISANVENMQLILSFADNCSGIAPENLDKIFEPFFTTKPIGQGTGLGLSIAKRIVSRYSGKIQVESHPGKGAAFRVSLPLRQNLPHDSIAPIAL